MTHIIALINQKGGVGKTTLTINLGAALAQRDDRVLLLDLDPQGHLTEGVGFQDRYLADGPNLYTLLTGAKPGTLAHLIRRHATEPYAVVPAHYQLMLAEQTLYMTRNREHKLKALLAQVDGQFDWILLDCPPSLGNLTDNALNAAGQVVIPIKADGPSVRALDLLFDQIESVERGLGIRVGVVAVVPNEVQDSAMAKTILTKLRASIPSVIPFELRKRVILQAAWSQGCSIFAYQPASRAEEQTRREVADLYTRLADLVTERLRGGKHG